jgi:hypothetical protein
LLDREMLAGDFLVAPKTLIVSGSGPAIRPEKASGPYHL